MVYVIEQITLVKLMDEYIILSTYIRQWINTLVHTKHRKFETVKLTQVEG